MSRTVSVSPRVDGWSVGDSFPRSPGCRHPRDPDRIAYEIIDQAITSQSPFAAGLGALGDGLAGFISIYLANRIPEAVLAQKIGLLKRLVRDVFEVAL